MKTMKIKDETGEIHDIVWSEEDREGMCDCGSKATVRFDPPAASPPLGTRKTVRICPKCGVMISIIEFPETKEAFSTMTSVLGKDLNNCTILQGQ